MAEVDSVDVITNRIIQIAAEVVDNVSDVFPADLPNTLPFGFVDEGTATYAYPSAGTIAVSREWTITVWVQEYTQSDQPVEQVARRAARPYITRLARLFGERRQLQDENDAALDMVIHSEPTTDQGADSAQRDGHFFAGLQIRLSVTYREYLFDE